MEILVQAWQATSDLHSFLSAIILTLVTSFLLWLFRAKVKIVYGTTSNNYHHFKLSDDGQPASIWTEKFYIQNVGKKAGRDIEIVFSSRLSSYNLFSPRSHTTKDLDSGYFSITVPSLAAGDLLILDVIDIDLSAPKLISVNCPDAIAKEVKFLPMRQFDKSVYAFVLYLMISGVVGSFYALLLIIF